MPKIIPLASVLIIAGLSVAVALEARSISDLTQRLKAAEAGLQAAAQRGKSEAARAQEVQAQSEVFQAESQALRNQIATGEPAPAPAAGKAAENPGAEWSKAFGKMFSDPKMKEMMRKQQAMAARMMYADFIKQLGLSTPDADRLMELLGDRQADLAGKGMALMSGKSDPAAAEALAKDVSAAKDGFDAKLKAMLGDGGYGQFQDYEKTLGDRMIMQQYQQQFAASNQPLENTQRDALLQIMTEERLKSPTTPFDSGRADPAAQLQAFQSDQAIHDLMANQDDFDRRVLERAGQVLAPDQLQAFKNIQKQISEMQQVGLKVGRSMFQKQ